MKIVKISADELNIPHLVSSLRSTCCPACTSSKPTKRSLCRRCFNQLSKPAQTALYNPIGSGYEQAMATALEELGKCEVFVPFPKRTNRPYPDRKKESA